MRLNDLSPHWITMPGAGDDKLGLTFRCPHCPPGERGETTYLGVWFKEPIDPDAHPGIDWPTYMLQNPERTYWHRAGDSFDNLTLSPSVDASAVGHWHGFIQNGEIR